MHSYRRDGGVWGGFTNKNRSRWGWKRGKKLSHHPKCILVFLLNVVLSNPAFGKFQTGKAVNHWLPTPKYQVWEQPIVFSPAFGQGLGGVYIWKMSTSFRFFSNCVRKRKGISMVSRIITVSWIDGSVACISYPTVGAQKTQDIYYVIARGCQKLSKSTKYLPKTSFGTYNPNVRKCQDPFKQPLERCSPSINPYPWV